MALAHSLPLFLLLLTLSQSLFVLAFVISPTPLRVLLFLPIAALNVYLYLFVVADSSVKSAVLIYIFIAADYLLLTDAQNVLARRNSRAREQTRTCPVSSAPWTERLAWAVDLLLSPRGIGWTHEPPAPIIPPAPPRMTPRASFVLSRLESLLAHFVLHDFVATFVTQRNPSFRPTNTPRFGEHPLPTRCVAVLGLALGAWSFMSMVHAALAMLAVGLGVSSPEEWPHLFGGWQHAYSVRTFWGRTWHQLLRRMLTTHGKHVTHGILKLPHKSKRSSYARLCTAFLITGLVHTTTVTSTVLDTRPFIFFTSQPLAIAFEQVCGVLLAGKVTNGKWATCARTVGYVWTFAWFMWCLPPYMDSLAQDGILEIYAIDGMRNGLLVSQLEMPLRLDCHVLKVCLSIGQYWPNSVESLVFNLFCPNLALQGCGDVRSMSARDTQML